MIRLSHLLGRGQLWPLAPASALVGAIASARDLAFRWGLLPSQAAGVPVISVGNCIAGGSGKTPVVAELLDLLLALKRQPAVIARGYGAEADGRNDEAKMLPGPVHCHPRRVRAAAEAIAAGADCLIMDDGFQHRALQRHLDLVCIDASRPWGWVDSRRGAYLPWGLMREGPAALRRAQALIASRWDQASEAQRSHLRNLAHGRQLPLLRCQHRPHRLRPVHATPTAAGAGDQLEQLPQGRWLALSAIAHPQAFHHTLRQAGAQLVEFISFPDHHHFRACDLRAVRQRAAQHKARVICTAKDAVKLAALVAELPAMECWCLDIQLHWEGQDRLRLQQLVVQALL